VTGLDLVSSAVIGAGSLLVLLGVVVRPRHRRSGTVAIVAGGLTWVALGVGVLVLASYVGS
jgi:hypothetical protein